MPDADAAAALADLAPDVRVEAAREDLTRAGAVEVLMPPDWPLDRLRAAMAAMPRLRVVQSTWAGVEWILDAIPPGVTLCSANEVHSASVADWVVGAILAMERGLAAFRDAQREQRWAPADTPDMAGRTVLLLGHGAIGAAVEARLAPFGMRFNRVARRPRDGVEGLDAVPALLPEADVVVIGLPLTPQTERLVDAAFLARMKPGALLVNPGRGRHVVTDDLLEALHAGRVRAALDVTDPEPLPDGHPLWSAPGVLVTPHVAGDTLGRHERASALLREQLLRLRAGEPLVNVVAEGY
ncbi:MAG TPA: NAD(P)-dependent oxidoreductase [Solirubrobacteraceae bacterium]